MQDESEKEYFDFNALEKEYFSIGPEDDDLMVEYKLAIWTELNEAERRIFSIYLEEGTYAGTARFFGISTPTARKKIKKIIWKIS